MTLTVAADEELDAIAAELRSFVESAQMNVGPWSDALLRAAERIGKAWSGSWLGYHANVYYAGLMPPPAGAHFSQEWGLQETFAQGTVGDWIEHDPDDVRSTVVERAGDVDVDAVQRLPNRASRLFQARRMDVLSVLAPLSADAFLKDIRLKAEEVKIENASTILRAIQPRGQQMTRDALAATSAATAPPHLAIFSVAMAARLAIERTSDLAELAQQASNHIRRHRVGKSLMTAENIFIGHGRSRAWYALKDFLESRLRLSVVEFNSEPVAGVSTSDRLADMLNAATMAFLIMTAEDEQADGSYRPRLNVVHEAGLFQGRLGFTRAIILLQEGCEEFSNIHGLSQIRFPEGKIETTFEQVRRVLEREGIIGDDLTRG